MKGSYYEDNIHTKIVKPARRRKKRRNDYSKPSISVDLSFQVVILFISLVLISNIHGQMRIL
jgi:hypothetical protein